MTFRIAAAAYCVALGVGFFAERAAGAEGAALCSPGMAMHGLCDLAVGSGEEPTLRPGDRLTADDYQPINYREWCLPPPMEGYAYVAVDFEVFLIEADTGVVQGSVFQ